MVTVLPYRTRYSSGRDSCTKCGSPIPKSVIQLAVMEQSMTDDCIEPKWYELDCFFQVRRPAFETLIDGFANLRHIHQMEIRKHLGSLDVSASGSDTVKPHSSVDVNQPPAKQCNINSDFLLEKQMQKQNKNFYQIRGKLKTNTNKDDRIAILEANDQFVPEGNSEILNHLADVICFGAMLPCAVCKIGKFVFKNSIYCCTGNVSEWSKCVNTLKEPRRVPIQMPDKYHKCLRGNFEVQARILKNVPQIPDEDYELYVKQPLFDMEFFIIGETKKPRADVEQRIKQMGGKLATEIHENLTAVISNGDEVLKMGTEMRMVRKYGIDVVPEEYMNEVKECDPVALIKAKDLSNWGQDLNKRIPESAVTVSNLDSSSSGCCDIPSSSGLSKVQNMKWKNGSVVDPDSKVEDIAHVCWIGNLQYSAILDLVDISSNKNSYFKMQLLESDTQPIYWLFESKGRIATSIGTVDIKQYLNLQQAIAAFKSLYLEKTGNEFGVKQFVKKPGKYNRMLVENRAVLRPLQHNYTTMPSRLSRPLFELMELLFDVTIMESALLGFDLDLGKMPLGNISTEQIQSAVKLLQQISALLTQSPSNEIIIAASNQFYSRIPHNFGLRRPPVINTAAMIKEKLEMLDAMQQMEITYYLLSEDADERTNPLDIYYGRLTNAVNIVVLDPASEEYGEIYQYVRNTQIPTPNIPLDAPPFHVLHSDELKLIEIFKVSRHDEIERFRRFAQTPNRRLLWHGTRLTNLVGILTNGLRAPPARTTGGRFRRGIYFSDSLSKSFGYCLALDQNMSVLILLSEVALGRSQILNRFERSQLNPDCDSIEVVGQYVPHPIHVRADGLMVPNGKLERRNPSRLRFNEFVVFDEARVKIRYIVKLKINRHVMVPA